MNYTYAQLNNANIVIGISQLRDIVDAPHMILIESPASVQLGDAYASGVFTTPEPPAPPAPSRVLSKLDYMGRFTDAELTAIYTAAKTVVAVEIWLDKFKLAGDIDLDDPRTIDGLQQMESAGLIAAGRAALIAS